MKVNISISEAEMQERVRGSVKQFFADNVEIGTITVERPPISVSMTDAAVANQNKIWLIKLIRSLSCDINDKRIDACPGTPSNCIGLGDAKVWVEKYLSQNSR